MARTPRKRARDDDDASSPHSAASTPLKRSTGSPSARYLAELSLQNEHYNRELRQRLEDEEKRTGKTHREALLAAARAHERVRRQAQLEQERERLAVEEQQKKLEDEERRLLDAERQLQIEREIADERRRAHLEELELKANEERLRQEGEARQREEQRREQQRREDKSIREEKAREEQRKADEEAKKREALQQAEQKAARPPETNGVSASAPTHSTTSASEAPKSALVTSVPERDVEHQQYLDIHKRLKEMRKSVTEQIKANKQLKKQVGDWRRDINSRITQATGEKGGTTQPRMKISDVLKQAMNIQQPSVDIRDFLAPGRIPNSENAPAAGFQVSGIFLYLLNLFAKGIVSQWVMFAGADIQRADAPGVLAVSLFANDAHQWRGTPLMDVLIAKLHQACPVLFGVYGSDRTDAGRRRLGWRRDPETGAWASEQQHGDRMAGLGAGFSAISLRRFPAKSALVNPYPSENWWRACARIINTPQGDVTNTHCIVLKGMVESQAPRVVEIFNGPGRVALRTALVDFPAKAPPGAARTGLETLPAVLQRQGLQL